ncbi:hypothetical protein C8A00DRAFT_18022, partial [Chaetomidium leptoderma]
CKDRPQRARASTSIVCSRCFQSLVDIEIRVSCGSNQIPLEHSVEHQALGVHITIITLKLESMGSVCPPHQDELAFLREMCDLMRQKDILSNSFMKGLAERVTLISDAMAECDFGPEIPCRDVLAIIPLSPPVGLPAMSIREVALGFPIFEWVDKKLRSYRRSAWRPGRSEGDLERRLWNDLPRELKRWVREPEPVPLGFLISWHQALSSETLRWELVRCLETLRQAARADQGNSLCQRCNPNNHRLTRKPRGTLMKRALSTLKRLFYCTQ